MTKPHIIYVKKSVLSNFLHVYMKKTKKTKKSHLDSMLKLLVKWSVVCGVIFVPSWGSVSNHMGLHEKDSGY